MKRNRIAWTALLGILTLLPAAAALAGALPKPVSKNAEAQKLVDQAWALEKQDSTAAIYKQCVGLAEQAVKLDPQNDMLLVDLSRYWWNYGDNLPKATKEQQAQLEEIYAKGIAEAEKSLAIKETVPGHYWLAVNKASSLEFSSIFSQVAGFPTIYSHSDYVTTNEPDYYYGAPGRLWSEILTRVPKVVVKMVGWDVNEAVGLINDAIKLEPRYLDNYVYKARFYWVYFVDKDEALKNLELALSADPSALPEAATANRVAQRDAKELWKKITGKDYPSK